MTEKNSITIVTPVPQTKPPIDCWQPVAGQETLDVVSHLPKDSRQSVIDAAVSILGRGANPKSQESSNTGLVVGYVQSGKTLSFTTVIALARENGYRLIISVAGTSIPLFTQSFERLQDHLSTVKDDGYQRWKVFDNPTKNENFREINKVLKGFGSSQTLDIAKRTVLITVMKNHFHLKNLNELLHELDLNGIPSLIVDDEADQASLNTSVNKGSESTTYKQLLALRDTMPCHTFLQYTATPQAPLLIDITDNLSPDFVEVLDSGNDYVGGKKFFGGDENGLDKNCYVKTIPNSEVENDDPFSPPPKSLKEALQIFFVGAACGLLEHHSQQQPATKPDRRSMLVHPSRKTASHKNYKYWIDSIVDNWNRTIMLKEHEPDRINLIKSFKKAYDDINLSVNSLPPFEKIVGMLSKVLEITEIKEINTRRKSGTPVIQWGKSYSWILVGGQSMDRGFTVEGLTVTYMPRKLGVGNADTIQQRGRFFGYKNSYLGYCRVYLRDDVRAAFCSYVEHEEKLRDQLKEYSDENKPLDKWKRTFILEPNYLPCRSEVIQQMYLRGAFGDKWFNPQFVPPDDTKKIHASNSKLTDDFLNGLKLSPDNGHLERNDAQKHIICRDVRLSKVFDDLLSRYKLYEQVDSKKMTGILFQISHALQENPDEKCAIYRMSPDYRRRREIVDSKGKMKNLYQGAERVETRKYRGSIYPGDQKICERDSVTIQIHVIDLSIENDIIAKNVPVIAIWIPKRMKVSWISQQ